MHTSIRLVDDLMVLGLRKGAGIGEVRSAYRRLTMQYHPDLHGNNRSFHFKFIALTEAYQRCLSGLCIGEPRA
jgi:DnaJ-class molecular chaperone